MKQETFTDIEYSFRKKKTKREEFLEICCRSGSIFQIQQQKTQSMTAMPCGNSPESIL